MEEALSTSCVVRFRGANIVDFSATSQPFESTNSIRFRGSILEQDNGRASTHIIAPGRVVTYA